MTREEALVLAAAGEWARIPPEHRERAAAQLEAALSMADAPHERPDTLADIGSLYITARAAKQYRIQAVSGMPAAARRSLHVLLLDARPVSRDRWRRRDKVEGIDITARVSREGRLAVVNSIGIGGGHRRRR